MIRLFEENDLLAPISVLLETEWVLRGVSGLDRETVSFALRRLADSPR